MITNIVLILQDCLFARHMVDRFGNGTLTQEQLALKLMQEFLHQLACWQTVLLLVWILYLVSSFNSFS